MLFRSLTTYGRDSKGEFHLPGEYLDAVRKAGGLPIMLAPGEQNLQQILQMVNGVIWAGGGDINPERYNGNRHESVSRVDDERDDFELNLAHKILKTATPVLGICRGAQLLTVATGGTLVEHIPDSYDGKVAHAGRRGGVTKHAVQLLPGSRLADIFSESVFPVVSKHHQGLRQITSDWLVTARAADDVVEAIEHKRHPWCCAVQWHPELAPEDKLQERLFKAFVDATIKK